MKEYRIQITKDDIELLRFINDFGFVEMPQIIKKFSFSIPHAYRKTKRLVRAGYLKHQRVLYTRPGAYFLTKLGASLTDLPPIEKIPIGYYGHQIALTDVTMKLQLQYPDAKWMGERRLKCEIFKDGVGKRGHISDGIFTLMDGKQVAIEVELSTKGKQRIDKILRGYRAQYIIREVWYFCSPAVLSILTELSQKMPFVKIFNLAEFLS